MGVLNEWVGSILERPVLKIDRECLRDLLCKCDPQQSAPELSVEQTRTFFDEVFSFSTSNIIYWDNLFGDSLECEIVAFFIIAAALHKPSAHHFVDAALKLDSDIQYGIFESIHGPMTQILNEYNITRNDLLKVLRAENMPQTPEKNGEANVGIEDNEHTDECDQGFVTSTPVPQNASKKAAQKTPPRPNSLKVAADDVQLMPPPSQPPPRSNHNHHHHPHHAVQEDRDQQPPMSPLTPLKNFVESPHWNTKDGADATVESSLVSKLRVHELEQRLRTSEVERGRAEAERDDAEAAAAEARAQLTEVARRAAEAEAEVARLRRAARAASDTRDELVEARAEVTHQAEQIKILEERLAEAQAACARVRELEAAAQELERQLRDRDTRIDLLLQKLSEIKSHEMVNIELQTLRLRLKEAEARLAEELREREALERDVRSQQTVVQQMQIDKRVAEMRSRSQQQQRHLLNTASITGDNDHVMESSFDVSISAITTANSAAIGNAKGENLGDIFNREVEAARAQVKALEQELKEANGRARVAEETVARLREALNSLETSRVLAEEAKAAAEAARTNLAEDVGVLLARLEFQISAEGLVTDEVTRLAEALIQREERVVQSAWDQALEERAGRAIAATTQTEAGSVTSIGTSTEPSLEEPNSVELNKCLVTAENQIAHLNEEVATLKEALREEAALSSRAHHNCAVNEREARRFHALWQRQRGATAAFLRRLERRGIIEASASPAASVASAEVSPTGSGSGELPGDPLAKQLEAVYAQLELNVDHMEEIRSENIRLKDEVDYLRHLVPKNRDIKMKLRSLAENSEYLEAELKKIIRRQSGSRDGSSSVPRRGGSQRHRPTINDAQDTDEDSVAYTDLSEVSSSNHHLHVHHHHHPTSSSGNEQNRLGDIDDLELDLDGLELDQQWVVGGGGKARPPHPPPPPPAAPVAFVVSPPHAANGRRAQSGQAQAQQKQQTSVAPRLTHPQSVAEFDRTEGDEVSSASNVTQTYPAAHNGNSRANGPSKASSSSPERPEDKLARLMELRRRNDAQPYHLRTNYALETMYQSPNELLRMLQTVHKQQQQQQQQQQQNHQVDNAAEASSASLSAATPSPMPAGRRVRPKGLQSISEVLLTGASGIIDAEKLDLTSTHARPSESGVFQSASHRTHYDDDEYASHLTSDLDSTITPRHNSPPPSTKKQALAFEVELSPPARRRQAPPPFLLAKKQEVKASSTKTTQPPETKTPSSRSVFKVPSVPRKTPAAMGWASQSAIAASNSRRPLKEATGKVNR